MPTVSFEDLQVYHLAETLADEVWGIVIAWDQFARDTVGKQLVRAADSIGAIERRTDKQAEAHHSGSFTKVERVSSIDRPRCLTRESTANDE